MAGPGTFGRDSTIGGFEYAASYMFSSQAIFVFVGARSSIALNGSLANEMIRDTGNGMSETFKDPMEDMLDKFREIAFRASVRAGKDRAFVTDAQQSVTYHGTANHSIYITDFRYMIAAAVVHFLRLVAARPNRDIRSARNCQSFRCTAFSAGRKQCQSVGQQKFGRRRCYKDPVWSQSG
jgi:hypothetical protein